MRRVQGGISLRRIYARPVARRSRKFALTQMPTPALRLVSLHMLSMCFTPLFFRPCGLSLEAVITEPAGAYLMRSRTIAPTLKASLAGLAHFSPFGTVPRISRRTS